MKKENEREVSNEYNDEDPDLLQSLLVNRFISKNLAVDIVEERWLLFTCGISQCQKRRNCRDIPKAIFI